MLPRMLRTFRPLSTRLPLARPLSTSARLFKGPENKDWTDREEIRPTANEYSKTASDSDSAAIESTAFSKDKTRPEEQVDSADKESGEGSNPLKGSPANHSISQPNDPGKGGPESSSKQSGIGPSDRADTSGKGSPKKSGQGKRYD